MIQINSTFQQRKYSEDEFGFGTFAWVPVTKEKIELLITRIVKSDLIINLVTTSRHDVKFTGIGKSKFLWSKAKGGTRNILFNPKERDSSVIAVIDSLLSIASENTGQIAPQFFVETSLDIDSLIQRESNQISNLSNITIICN